MAPLPHNNTSLIYVDYETCGENHTLQMRYAAGGSVSDAQQVVDNLFTAMSPVLQLVSIIGCRNQLIGTTVSFDVPWGFASGYGGSVGTHEKSAYYMSFIGRTIQGRRLRFNFFGLTGPVDGTGHDYRYDRSSLAVVDDVLTELELNSASCVAIDGLNASWKQYANIGVNAYWRNHIR